MKLYRLESGSTGLDPVAGEAAVPDPGPGEVRIRVRACSLNYRDLLMREGQSASSAGDGVIPLSDGAGEIEAVGSGVGRFAIGDRVAGCFFSEWEDGSFSLRYHKAALGGSVDGMLCEQVILPQQGVIGIPDSLSFAEAACLPCAGLTAWYSLVERGGLEAGQTVLVLGTGGVSIFALQIATAKGCRVIVTSRSDEKLAKARSLGAWETVNYLEHPDWDQEVWKLTGKQGVDHVVEVGGPGTLEKSMNCVAAGGHVALIGVLTGKGPLDASLFPLIARNVQLNGIYVGHRAAFERSLKFWAQTDCRPVIDRVFPFAEAPDAYDYLAAGSHFGKVVISMDA